MKRLRSPKVFISYCRKSQDKWALALAKRLRTDGVDVQIDVWHLNPGDDMYAFMERMVTDRSVSKVLILCDKEYRDRSDNRKGGVGVEAQIISPALYRKVSQSKFIPLIREFHGSEPVLAAYLASRYALDFSTESAFDLHYSVLLDLIYGVGPDIPPLGKPRHGAEKPTMTTSEIGGGLMGLNFEDGNLPDPEETVKNAQRFIQDDPSAKGYNLAGTVLAAAGLHRAAVKHLAHSIQLDENQPSAWFNLGQAYELIGEIEKASDAIIHALQLRRTFSKTLRYREAELPPRVRKYLAESEDTYRQLLSERSALIEKAIIDLQASEDRSKESLVKIDRYEINKGANLAQFIIHLVPDGVAMVLCYPEELRGAEIVLPFHVPNGVTFAKQKLRFMDHFGYEELEFTEPSDSPPPSPVYFAGRLDLTKLSAKYLLGWIIRSILFQEQGTAFLQGRQYWEVQLDDSEAAVG